MSWIFIGLIVAALVTLLGLTTNKRNIYILAVFIILFSAFLFLYSILYANGFEGMRLSVVAIAIFTGTTVGIVLMTLIPINNKSITNNDEDCQ